MDKVCYNCFKVNPDHVGMNCPEPQKYTRCNPCKRVCERPDNHYRLCPNRTFVSEYIDQPGTARFATLVADFKVSTMAKLFLLDGPKPMDISTEFNPIQVDANYGLLLGSSKALKYYQWHPAPSRRCVINVADKSNSVRFSARLTDDVVIINKKIRVRRTGAIELRTGDVPTNEISQAEVTLKADTDSPFKITIYAFEKKISFEISQNGVRYLPPEWLPVECPICYDNMVGGEVRMTPCMHMFCTVCILRTLDGRGKCQCPVCREEVTEQSLRSIYLYS